MTKYNPRIHNRRSIRLKGYDYAKAGLYFITICCQDRAHLFGEIIDGEMNLNLFGQIAYEEWLQTEQIRENCKLHEFIIMPNHIHGIIEISFNIGENEGKGKFQSPSHTIGSFIRGFKIATIKKIKDRINNSGCTGELQFAPTELSESAPTELSESAPTELSESAPTELSESAPTELSEFAPTELSESAPTELSEFAPTELSEFAPTELSEFAPTELSEFALTDSASQENTAPTKKIKELDFKIWQRNYYEIIIRNQTAYNRISNYIINNPAKWNEDKFYKK